MKIFSMFFRRSFLVNKALLLSPFMVYKMRSKIEPKTVQEQYGFDYYNNMNLYSQLSMGQLLNKLWVNKYCHYAFLIDRAESFYNFSQYIFTRRLVNWVIKKTVGKVFTGGEDLKSMEELMIELNKTGQAVILNFADEPIEGFVPSKKHFDMNRDILVNSIISAKKCNPNNTISLKMTGLVAEDLLKKVNEVQDLLNESIDNAFQGKQQIKFNKLNSQLQSSITNEATNEKVKKFVSNLQKKQLNDKTVINYVETKSSMHAFNLYKQDYQKVSIPPLIEKSFNFNEKEINQLKLLGGRLHKICEAAQENQIAVKFDAEQTYFQRTIDSIVEQLQDDYNNDKNPIIFNTVQSYLKSSMARIQYEIDRAKLKKQPIGWKLVRGCYMYEERRLAKENDYPDPIHDNLEATANSYNQNFQYIIKNKQPNSKVLVASHNTISVRKAQQFIKNYPDSVKKTVMFGQLYGLADHLTFSLLQEGYLVYKCVPYAPTNIIVPYLIRRAKEAKTALESVHLQYDLMKSELKHRLNPFS